MRALTDRLGALALSRSFWLLTLMAALLIGPSMWPVQWSGNEINYFDLSYRFARPEAFTDHHAVFDESRGRVVPFLLIGKTVEWLGFEAAKTVLALLLWLLCALGLAAVARELGLRVAELGLGLVVFLREQGILGNEWLFETVEAKVFAYVAVLFGLAAGLRGRWTMAMVAAGIATYMHFLVGGFWALALLSLHLLRGGRLAGAVRHGLLFAGLVLPVFLILLRERIGVAVDTSGLGMTLNQIYTRHSVLFHVAPLIDGVTGFVRDWLLGLCVHVLLLAGLIAFRDRFPDRAVGRWLIGLNLYVLIALAVYMADNGSFRLAQFYLLRPEGLTYLLSLLVAAQILFRLATESVAPRLGALAAGGRTIAVLGSGVLNIYPPEHLSLANEVIAHGALLSESPPRSEPLAGTFPQRNRLISGMALGVLVVEAGEHSGALITARHAAEQGREVFAVPGHVDDRPARGCHRLIRDGAKLVETVDDILEELGPLYQATVRDDGHVVRHPAELVLNELEQQVLAAVGTSATSIDEIVAQTGLPVAHVLSTISVLEMRHVIRRLSGSSVARV
jgi:DNA processing protein